MTTALILVGIAYCVWKLVTLLIDHLLIDPLIDIFCPLPEEDEICFTVKITVEHDQAEMPPNSHEGS